MSHGERRCLGLFGPFDADGFDVQLRVRVAIDEIARRRPDLTLRLFAPFGSARPISVAADLALEPLTPLTAARRAALTSELTATVMVGAGADVAYADHPAFDPRDVAAAYELFTTGLDALPAGHDPVEPHPGLLARRVWPFGVCEQRREFLRAMHWWPQRGAATVVAGTDADLASVDALAARLSDREVTVIGMGTADAAFGLEVCARLGRRAHHMPSERSSMEDRIAACAGAASVVSNRVEVLAVADAYGRPRRAIDGQRAAKRAATTFGRDEAALDRVYDELAALVPGELTPLLASGEILALRTMLDGQARRVAHERVVLADYVRAVRNNAALEAAELRTELDRRPLRKVRDALRRRRS